MNSKSFDHEEIFLPNLFVAEPPIYVRRPKSCFEREQRLLLELLLDGIECWQGTSNEGISRDRGEKSARVQLRREAEIWIFGRYNNPPFFSFAQTCECLGLDPDFLRRRLLERRDRGSTGDGRVTNSRPTSHRAATVRRRAAQRAAAIAQ
jgi:hypothetical protein